MNKQCKIYAADKTKEASFSKVPNIEDCIYCKSFYMLLSEMAMYHP